jgi:uncharacterized protein YjbJ (UPF0337 family)
LRAELPQRRRQFLQGERGFGIVDRGQRRCCLVVDRCGAAACRAQVGVESVAHDGEQPPLEIRAGGELGLLVERREDSVLNEIVGGLALAAKEAREGAEVRKQPHDVVLNHRVAGSRGAVNFGTLVLLCGQSIDRAQRISIAQPRARALRLGSITRKRICTREERIMNWDRIEGNWKQLTGKVKEQWGKLTEDDLTVINGKQDQLVGRVQERYGIAKDEAERQVKDWADRM